MPLASNLALGRWAGILVGLHLAVSPLLAHSANEPVPRSDQRSQDRHKLINSRVAESGSAAKVVFIGDSITQGWEGAGKEVWAKYYAERHAINLGIGGDRTQHVLWRLENGNLAGIRPKAAVIMIGTNNSNGDDNTPEQIVDGVRAVVSKVRTAFPETKVLLLAIFPRSENFCAQRGKLAQVNQALRRLADGRDIVWADLADRFLNDDGTIPQSLMPDFLHLSPAGYAIWAEAMEPQLAELIGDAPAAVPAGATLTGEWELTIPGPDGQPVRFPASLRQEGDRLTGRVARGQQAGKFLEIEDGRIVDGRVSWTIRRDREGGAAMIYRMSGTVSENGLKGTTEAELDGSPITSEWTAKRR